MEKKIQRNETVFAIILAAGYSSRMGAFKPLLPIGDKVAIERIIETLEQAQIGEILVVAGYKKEQIYQFLSHKKVAIVDNDQFDKGMFSSIQKGVEAGIKAIESHGPNKKCAGFFLNLVDSPLTPHWVLEKILEKHEGNKDSFIVPCYRGKKGHPLFIPSKYIADILKHDGTGGLKTITNKYEHKLIRMEVEAEEVVLDMDTPEAYEELKEYERNIHEGHQAGMSTVKFMGLVEVLKKSKIQRIMLVRHGQPQQHSGKILLGQTDIGLSKKGKDEALLASGGLWDLGIGSKTLYTSDLKRARETAEIIKLALAGKNTQEDGNQPLQLKLEEKDFLREMNLGQWDGKLMEEIKEKWPAEFEKRGNNLLTYKNGLDSENFYDLQYRVLKGFEKIIDTHREKDLILVTHGGVIKVLLANLEGVPLREAIKKKIGTGEVITINIETL